MGAHRALAVSEDRAVDGMLETLRRESFGSSLRPLPELPDHAR